MKILVPLFALLLIGSTATAQEKGHIKEMYHVSWTDQHGKPKCHNGASKMQAEKNAAKKRTKKGITNVKVSAGKCDHDRDGRAEGKPGQAQKPKPTGQKPQVARPTHEGPSDQREAVRKEKEKKEMKVKKEKKAKEEKEEKLKEKAKEKKKKK